MRGAFKHRKSPKDAHAGRAKDIATRRSQAGLGDLVMDETNTSTGTTKRTRYRQSAYGPQRKMVSKRKSTKSY